MQDFINFFGHGFCHQISSRTLESGGYLFSVCARDTGIYLGFVFAIAAGFIVYARVSAKPGNLPPWPYIIVLAVLVIPMALDGVSSYLGLRESTNTIRYTTGVLTGFSAGSLTVPLLFSLTVSGDPQKKALADPKKIILHIAIAAALSTLFYLVHPYLDVVSPLLVIVAFIVMLGSLNLVIITLSKRFAPQHKALHWVALLSLVLLLSLTEITLLGALREAAQHFLIGGTNVSSYYE